ncbi:uncharacterized protein VICG_00001 [Vittaforma corneae ATCC 50505]|uniref:mRNA cap guanine-N(7) methyltransferase n=1 Tax=Vittaforma corneae (strain ATCC 50505) TaxID=993615 RepID=L2GPD4_VITCO|nr:uncharacterized protein VICG_00001 [Vittaforma corneae ATCC 50505]ELA42686.1 hypothetical protein VICG_00001 [Vittaforma corneae ATCC 50505]
MDDKESIKRHYNQIPNKSRQERRHTRNINIRNANNFIKSCIIKSYVKPCDSVLDIGVGKGGDFIKYQIAKVKEVYGLDIANRSILDALSRARESHIDFKLVLKVKDCFTTRFDLRKKFDIVSIQFSFHYCFAKEEYVHVTLDNIEKHLVKNGHVLITIPCKEEILKRAKEDNLSNRFYSIRFKDRDSEKIYGNAYYYTLLDSVNDCVEYLVDMKTLVSKAQQRGLELVKNTPFREFYDENAKLYTELHDRLVSRPLNKEEEEVVSLHHIIVFKKIS